MRGHFTFGEISSLDYGIYISAGSAFNAPEEEVETVQIPGRSGDLIVRSGRFSNIELTYPAFSFARSKEEFQKKMMLMRNAMKSQRGYQKLRDSYNPREYRLAMFRSAIEVTTAGYLRGGSYDLTFEAKPYRYLISGEEEKALYESGTIENPTMFDSLPLLKVEGFGTVHIGSYSFVLAGAAGQTTYIDCDTMEAYSKSDDIITSKNSYLTTGAEFPRLIPGENEITLPDTVTKLTITPRWRIL